MNERTSFLDDLKARIRPFKTRNADDIIAEKIKSDPKYVEVLAKLEELYNKRKIILSQLENVELDIDACLLLLAMSEKKEENKNVIKDLKNPSARIND